MSVGRRAAQLATLTAFGALPGVVLADIIEPMASVTVAAATALAATLTASATMTLVGRRATSRPLTVAIWSVVAMAGSLAASLLVVLVWPESGSGGRGTVDAVADALVHGWSAVITSPVPADAEPRLLIPLAVLAWSATFTSTSAALRSPKPARLLVPGSAAVIAAAVAAGAHQFEPVWVGLAFAVTAGAVLVASCPPGGRSDNTGSRADRRSRRTTIGGAFTAAATVAIVAGVVGVALGPQLTFGRDHEPFDPRDHLDPPVLPHGAVNPLELVASRLQQPDEPMFTVTADEPVPTRLVALDSFDGARWSSSATYERTGTELSPPGRSGIERRHLRAEISIEGLDGPWLPSIGDPTRVTGADVLIDPASGSLLIDGEASPGSYAIEAELPEPTVDILQPLPSATDDEGIAAAVAPPGLPEELAEMARVATEPASSPFTQALLLERYMSANFTVDGSAPGGHSYGHLLRALTVNQSGTSEQFATGFAVLGRAVGLPTRVVVGFGPGEETADGIYSVRSGDVQVWPEVRFADVGLVAFDPTPGVSAGDSDGGNDLVPGGLSDRPVLQQAEPPPPVDELLDTTDDAAESPSPPPETDDRRGSSSVLLVGSAVVVTALTTAPLLLIVSKRRRTARRRRAVDARVRTLGAWHDVLDRLQEAGVSRPTRLTVEEIVAEVDDAATSALVGMYRPISRALYDDGAVDIDDAQQAWRARDRFVQALRRDATWRQRIGWALDPRPVLRRTSWSVDHTNPGRRTIRRSTRQTSDGPAAAGLGRTS